MNTYDSTVYSAKEILAGRSSPTPTREILKRLVDRDVEIGGTSPQNALSSILSKSPEFIPHGRSGWTLAVQDGHETEKVDDADPSPDTSSTLFQDRPSQPVDHQPAQGREAVPGGGT